MKSIRYFLAISILLFTTASKTVACGPYYPDDPTHILMFRSCSPELERQWQDGCRFQDYEKYENCLLWQKLTSTSISLNEIEEVVYESHLKDLQKLPEGPLSDNRFAQWLISTNHSDDLEYILIAKEIEDIRDYMNDPWYYSYDGDEEHLRLDELLKECQKYKGKRHADRYALQLMRLYFAKKDFSSCINLWESSAFKMPQNIVTDMIASYAGGAYSRMGNRDKAIELYTRSEDIGSLINLKAWNNSEEKSDYKDPRVSELEYIFNRFPNSPLLSVRLQEYVRNRESFVHNYADWKARGFHDPVTVKTYWKGDSLVANAEPVFYNELKRFAEKATVSTHCRQKGMWNYALGYLYFLDGDMSKGKYYLNRAEHSANSPFMKESIKAFRFLMDSQCANNDGAYLRKLLIDLKWLDKQMAKDVNLSPTNNWQYNNKLNWRVCYWQDLARKVILGVICPKMKQVGNFTLALQLANYASNRIVQLAPLYEAYHYGYEDPEDKESYSVILPFDEYRKSWSGFNYFDYQNQFFESIYNSDANNAAQYAQRITHPESAIDKFLNERSYVDNDYICDIVGTLYLREMNYEKAVEWLSKVSKDYQNKTNLAKEGYFKLDPFQYQFDKKNYISESNDYKLRFAQEMDGLEKMINSDAEPNRKANAKIRFAIGLRNSFGKCWYLTQYGYHIPGCWNWSSSTDREGFKKNDFAQKAYKKVDALMTQALSEFTDEEQAAQAHLEMMNYATLMIKYSKTKVASKIRGRCDNYYDYALQKQ